MNSADVQGMQYHPMQERITEVLTKKIQNDDKNFFRLQVAFYFAQMASSMRCSVYSKDRGEIPVNMYAVNLATSG